MNHLVHSAEFKIVEGFLREQTPTEHLPHHAVALFVMGNIFVELPKHAAHLFLHQGIGRIVVATGKGDAQFLGGCRSEAEFCKKVMMAEGVAEELILTEERSINTLENVRLGMDELERSGLLSAIAPPYEIVVVAIGPMLRRALATFRKERPDMHIFGSAPRMDYEKHATPERVLRMMSELDRLEEYGERGDILPTEIPPAVLAAAEATKHLAHRMLEKAHG